MRGVGMLLNDLDYFVALAEEKSFTKAAELKFVSQPSITNALHRLEKELGAVLLERNRGIRAISLTAAGEILFRHAKSILRETEIIKSEIANRQKIWLGVPPIIGATIFPKIMQQLGAEEIDAFTMVESGSSNMYELLDQDKVDMGFIGRLSPEKNAQYFSHFITKSPFVVVVPKGHPLAARQSVSITDLAGERIITMGDSFTQHRVLVDQLTSAGMDEELKNLYITNELMTEQGLIAAGNGVGLMMKLAVADRPDLVTVPLNEPIDFYIYLVQKRDHLLSEFENETKEKIVEAINALDL
jgi:DNA-binding transcriptional LysR family regulator